MMILMMILNSVSFIYKEVDLILLNLRKKRLRHQPAVLDRSRTPSLRQSCQGSKTQCMGPAVCRLLRKKGICWLHMPSLSFQSHSADRAFHLLSGGVIKQVAKGQRENYTKGSPFTWRQSSGVRQKPTQVLFS